ncbi:MAG: hypothetical protein M3P18_24135 [Actinomycetota bacterium]|nr:hypothetical protein [Actinomycetota bacterium]
MIIRQSSALGALLLTFAMLALVADVSAAPADPPGNSGNAKACQKDGWQLLQTSDGQTFASEEECTSYGAHGGVLVARNLIFMATVGSCISPGCWGQFTGSGLEPLSAVYLHYTFDGTPITWLVRYADSDGNVSSTGPGGWAPDEGIFVCGGSVTNVYLTGTSALGTPITSNVIETSPC